MIQSAFKNSLIISFVHSHTETREGDSEYRRYGQASNKNE
jgi:hypothetical protein